MTSTVTVTAHCGSDKEVRVRIEEDSQPNLSQVLEDGESFDFTIYDSRTVIVGEFEKEEIVEQGDDSPVEREGIGVEPDGSGNDVPPPAE